MLKKSLALAIAIAASAVHTPLAQAKDGVISDAWYVITTGKVPYGYYNDSFERKQGRIIFRDKFVKSEEGYLNEESLGAYAADDEELTPLFFNFRSVYRATETKIDGTVQPSPGGTGKTKMLTVRARRGTADLPVVTRGVEPKLILSTFFPLWLGRKLPSMKPGKAEPFRVVMEDNLELGFATAHGTVKLEAPDEVAKRTGTQRIALVLRDQASTWYVEKTGIPVRIEIPATKTLVERTTKEKAEKFLSR